MAIYVLATSGPWGLEASLAAHIAMNTVLSGATGTARTRVVLRGGMAWFSRSSYPLVSFHFVVLSVHSWIVVLVLLLLLLWWLWVWVWVWLSLSLSPRWCGGGNQCIRVTVSHGHRHGRQSLNSTQTRVPFEAYDVVGCVQPPLGPIFVCLFVYLFVLVPVCLLSTSSSPLHW